MSSPGWRDWFSSFFTGRDGGGREADVDSLQLSMSLLELERGWAVIESEQDRKDAIEATRLREKRQQELLGVKKERRRESGKVWASEFSRMLATVPQRERGFLFSPPLSSDMTFSILNRICKARYFFVLQVSSIFNRLSRCFCFPKFLD